MIKVNRNVLEVIGLASLAGLLYSSWPLGYLLNPVANRGLASNLQGVGQPYNWLFIILDVISGAIVCRVAWRLYKDFKPRRHNLIKTAIISYALFGVFTVIDALIPVDCAADEMQCGPLINHPLVLWHGALSIASIAFLTLSLFSVWWLVNRVRLSAWWVQSALHITVLVWLFFGFVTAVLLYLNKSSSLSQHIFILVCSLWTGTLPYVLHLERINKPLFKPQPKRL